MQAIFHRTSIRDFLPTPVEEAKLTLLLRAAMAAPSAGNQQPWVFYVVTNHSVLQELSTASPYAGCAKNAPLAIVPCYQKVCHYPEYALLDLSAATENLLLQADALGLGAVWLGIAPKPERMERVRQALSLPPELEAFAILPCGYPSQTGLQPDRYDPQKVVWVPEQTR